MTDLERAWLHWVWNLYLRPSDSYQSHRKFFQAETWEVPWSVWASGVATPREIHGFTTAKDRQLERTYFNREEVEKARTLLEARVTSRGSKAHQTCVTARFGAAAKDRRSQGYCMTSVNVNVLTRSNVKEMQLDFSYRTTEVTKKFFGDLRFLSSLVVPSLVGPVTEKAVKPTVVRFYFSQIYLSNLFLPILFRYVLADDMLECVARNDPVYAQRMASLMSQWVRTDKVYSFRMHRKMYEMMQEKVIPQLGAARTRRLKRLIGELA